MRIGPTGRFGICLILIALVREVVLQLIWKPEYPHYRMWQPYNPYLPILLFLGLVLVLHSLFLVVQEKRDASLPKFSLSSVGLQRPVPDQSESLVNTPFENSVYPRAICPPPVIFAPSGSNRKVLRWVGLALILLAFLLYAGMHQWSLFSGLLIAAGYALVFWPAVAETDEIRLQGEARATFRPKGGRRYPLPLQAVLTKPTSSLLTSSLCIVMVFSLLLYPFMIASLLTPMGFKIYIPKPGTLASFNQPWSEPLVLCVSESHFWYLNGLQVSQSDVERRVGDFLRVRGDKTVFVDAADSNPSYLTVEAIAEVQKVPDAKVILVTPDIMVEVPSLVGSSPCEALTPLPSRSH